MRFITDSSGVVLKVINVPVISRDGGDMRRIDRELASVGEQIDKK